MGKPRIIDNWPLWKKPLVFLKRKLRKAHRYFRDFPPGQYKNIMDIGAYKGEFTRHALNYFDPKHVWLVEADPAMADTLKNKLKGRRQCTIVHAAISSESGSINLAINSHRGSNSILPINPISEKIFQMEMKEVDRIKVPALSLDDLFKQEKIEEIDLMKIDIQGAEKLLIEGGKSALSKTHLIYMEVVFHEFYKGCARFDELHAALQAEGFKLRSMHEQRLGSDGALAYADGLFVNLSLMK